MSFPAVNDAVSPVLPFASQAVRRISPPLISSGISVNVKVLSPNTGEPTCAFSDIPHTVGTAPAFMLAFLISCPLMGRASLPNTKLSMLRR